MSPGLASDDGLRVDLRYSYAKAGTSRVGSIKVNNSSTSAELSAAADDKFENSRICVPPITNWIPAIIMRTMAFALV